MAEYRPTSKLLEFLFSKTAHRLLSNLSFLYGVAEIFSLSEPTETTEGWRETKKFWPNQVLLEKLSKESGFAIATLTQKNPWTRLFFTSIHYQVSVHGGQNHITSGKGVVKKRMFYG